MKNSNAYHNTTGLQGEFHFEAERKAKSQDAKILEFMRTHPLAEYSAEDLHRLLFDDMVPLQSVRRAVCNLWMNGAGPIMRTDTNRIGSWGKKIFCYKIRNDKTT